MENISNTPDRPEDKIHLLDYLIVLAKHSRMIISTSVAMTVLTYLILVFLPNKYTATARLMPPQQNLTMSGQLMEIMGGGMTPGTNTGGTSGIGGMAAGLLGLKSSGDLYVGILNGETIADHIIERFKLRELYKKKYIEDVRRQLKQKAKIETGRKDGIISVEITDEDAIRAADIANTFIEELDKLLQRLGVQEAKERLAFLENERLQASQNLAKAEETLRTFSEKNSVIQIDTQAKGMLEYIARMRAEIDAREVQIAVLRKQATSYNYDVIRMETEIKGMKEKLFAAEKQWDQACLGDVCIQTSKMPALGLDYFRLYRETRFQEGLYQLYNRMVELARLDMVKDVAVVQVVDKALPPERRSNKRLLPALFVGAFTFFLSMVLTFVLEYINNAKIEEGTAQRLAILGSYLTPYQQALVKIKNFLKWRNTA